jgi:hypothetical protein
VGEEARRDASILEMQSARDEHETELLLSNPS